MSQIGSSKRKLFDESGYGDGKGKKPRLQVTIPRLRLSQKQLERLRKISSKHQKAPLVANKEEDEGHVATVNASASPSALTTETVPTETVPTETVSTETVSPERVSTETVSTETVSTVVEEPGTTVEESPIRHRLTNLLDGTSLSPDGAAHTNEENVKSINCEEGGQLNNAESLSGPVSTEEHLFCPEELLSSDNGLSPLTHEEVCITVPCYPDVVSKTCMQVEIGCTQRLSDSDSQAADVTTASVQDKEDHGTNQRLEPSRVEERSSVSEEGSERRSVSSDGCDVLHQLSNNAVLDEKEAAENRNAEEGSGVMSRSAKGRPEDSKIDYSSHYNTLEAMNTLLTKFTEEKRARTELEGLVSHLEEKNKGLHSECEKLKDLVNDLLPSSKVKNETVSRGIQINMDLSLRRGRTVDRATSPLRTIREPSPDVTILSFSTGCQTVDLANEMKSTACQTDPPLDVRVPATCTAQSAAPTRVQGIVMPNVQGRAPVQVPNYTRVSNPVQLSHSQTPFQQQSAKVTVSQPLGVQSQQAHTNWQMLAFNLANMGQTTGHNNVASSHATTLNSPQVRISQPTGAALYAQVPQNQFIPISTQISGNQSLVGYTQGSYSGVYQTYSTLSTQQATRPDTYNQSTGQRLNLNTGTLSPLFTQNQLLAHSSAPLSHQTFPSAQGESHNSRPAQFVGALQHSTRQQTTPTSSLQISGSAQSSIRDVILHLANGVRRQINTTTAESLRHPQQPLGASLPSGIVYNQVTAPQHKEGLSLQHQASPPVGSQVQQLTSLRNSQQSLGAIPQSRVGYNQGTVPRQTVGLRTQHHVPQSEGSQAMPLTQTSSTSSGNVQNPLGTFPRQRMRYNQVAASTQTEGLRKQHQVSQPEASQVHLHAQPVQQNNVNRMTGQQSDKTSSSSRTSNTDNHLGDKLLENVLERRSLYSEVQLVYNELQKSLSEGKYPQKQSTTTQNPRSLDHQMSQLPTSKSTPPINKQPPDAASSTYSVSSVSQQSSSYYRTAANQLPIQVSPSESLGNGTQKRLLHFSQEADSNIPNGASPRGADGSRRLGSSAVRPTVGKDQKSSRHSVDNDPYKMPPKTPSGALEDVVKRLLTLQNEIARTENVSGTAPVSSNSLAESTDGASKADSTSESQGSKQTSGPSESTASSEKDSSKESPQHYSRNRECKSTESVSLNQGADTQGLSKNQHNNNYCCSSGNQDKAAEDTSVSLSSHNVSNTDFDKMQTESEPPSSVRGGKSNTTEKEIGDFPATEGEEQESDNGHGQDNSVGEGQDSSSPRPSGLAKGTENREPQDSDDIENDNSSQDIYAGLMSPIIPRMATARRARSLSDMHTTEDTCDVDISTSSINSPVKNVNSEDPEPKQTSDDKEQGFMDSQREGIRTCATLPSVDVHRNQNEHGSDTASNSEQENAVNDQQHAPLSSDGTMEEMQLEEDTQVSSTGGIAADLGDARQATCNTAIQEMPKTNLPEEQLSTELSEGQRDSPASVHVRNSNVKLEASDGPCMGGVAQGNNKERKDEQYQKCQLNPKEIPKQNFVGLYSTSQETPIVGDFKEIKKALFTLPLPSSLLKENVDEKGVSPDLVDSRTNVKFNNRNTAINNEPSPPLNTSPLPVPRLALRIMNGNTLVMWDLPPGNNITDISVFEIYVFLRNKDGRWQNRTDRWIKVGEMKAMPLPMGCTLRQVIQNDVIYSFIVRAVGKNGLPGPFSKPCSVSIL